MFFPALHTLRGLAALWVLVMHAWALAGSPDLVVWPGITLTPVAAVGFLGVHLFYALSGFLLAQGLFQRPPEQRRYGTFISRRFLRIFPAYYLQLAVLLYLAGPLGIERTLTTGQLLQHLVMYFNLPPDYLVPLNGVWWTLPVEFMFYLVLPLLVPLVERTGPLLFWIGCAGLEIGYRFLVFSLEPGWPDPKVSNVINQLPGVITIFGSGVVAAWMAARRGWRMPRPRLGGALAALAWAGWIAVLAVVSGQYWDGHVMLFTWGLGSGAATAAIIFCLHRLEPGSGWMTRRTPVWLGDVSYGIYLWHLPVMTGLNTWWLGQSAGAGHFVALLLTGGAITIALAAASYYAVERPAMRLGRHWSRLRRADPQAW